VFLIRWTVSCSSPARDAPQSLQLNQGGREERVSATACAPRDTCTRPWVGRTESYTKQRLKEVGGCLVKAGGL
jgi:hypothetical protein